MINFKKITLSFIAFNTVVFAQNSISLEIYSQGDVLKPMLPKEKSLLRKSSDTVEQERITGLNYLNSLRNQAGLISLSANNILDTSSQNHANYLSNQFDGHYEQNSEDPYYTGYSPSDRTGYAGYRVFSVSENLTSAEDIENSIDNLYSAIYHRFGFQSFTIDEIGMGRGNGEYSYDYYVYNMGNSLKEQLCYGESKIIYGEPYYKPCHHDEDFTVIESDYLGSEENIANQNPDYVIYPTPGYKDFVPVFYEEHPDPLPDLGISGNPISVKFNPYHPNIDNIVMKDINIYEKDGDEITATRFMIPGNMQNAEREFNTGESALFPLKVLKFNQQYIAEACYEENGIAKRINWCFQTTSFDMPIYYNAINNDNIFVESQKDYVIQIMQIKNNERVISANWTYANGSIFDMSFLEGGTAIKINYNGQDDGIAKVTLDLSDGTTRVLNFVLGNKDSRFEEPLTGECYVEEVITDCEGTLEMLGETEPEEPSNNNNTNMTSIINYLLF